MKIRTPLLFLAASGMVLLNGCISVGPDYEKPETPMPDAWHEAVQDEFKTGEPNLQTWWTMFNDPTMKVRNPINRRLLPLAAPTAVEY